MTKPIILYSHAQGPNPWKVAIVLEELGVPYEHKFVDMKEMHTPAFEKTNPNGRVPAIDDPNTGITLWESGAIIDYLIENYDKGHKISFASSPDKYYASQYLHFQTSGQGPYFGQFAWFSKFHQEKIPSAIERYGKEIQRVTKVLDGLLSDKEYLVGGKCSYADLVFIPWYNMMPFLDDQNTLKLEENNPNWAKWIARLHERPAVKKCLADRSEFMSKPH